MGLITATPTTGQVEGVTRRKVLERFLRETGFGDYGTATGGSVSTIVDTTRLQSVQYNSNQYDGAWERISYDAGGAAAAPELEIRTVSAAGLAGSTGTLTIAPVHSAAPAAGDMYQIWRMVYPQTVLDILDQIMQEEVFLPCWTVLTEVPDGDMEQISNSADWTASNATLTKATAEPTGWGKRYLTVATTSAAGYAKTATNLAVVPGKKYHISALVRANAAGCTPSLIAYDATNSAAIDSKTTTSQTWGRLWFEFTAPATCYQVSIRLANAENTVTSSWDEVCLYSLDSQDLPLPWWVKEKQQVKGIFRMHFTDIGTNLWNPQPYGELDTNRWDFRDDAYGRGQLRIVSRYGAPQGPVFIFGTRNEVAFANENTDTKRVDANWLNTALCYQVFSHLINSPNSGFQNTTWLEKQFARWEKVLERGRRKQIQLIEEVLQSETPDGLYYRNDWAANYGDGAHLTVQ